MNTTIFGKEPAVIIGAIMAGIALAVGFGLKISGQQIDLIKTFLEAALPLIAGLLIRTQVVPTQVANQQISAAIAAPPTTTVEQIIKTTK